MPYIGDSYLVRVNDPITNITSMTNASLKMGRDTDNLIDFATTDNEIILRVAGVNEINVAANALSPVTSDGAALGTTSLMWSDLFAASGSVLNFNNGDMTITHSSNTLTVAGGTFATAALTATTGVFSGTVTVGVDDTGYDVTFFGDTASRYWLWDTSADGVVQRGTLTVGVDDTGHDVKFFGASAGAYMEWDESADQLRIMGASADATTSTGKLLLATSLTDINANDVIGKIDFQAPHEAGGTDAITVAASIQAVAQGTFSASVNATDLIFYTGHSEAATEKFRFTSQGELGVGGTNYGTDGQVLTSGGAGAAASWATGGVSANDIIIIVDIMMYS